MWRISYLNLKNDTVEQKGDFASDKAANDWAMEQEEDRNIIALKLLVWSEMLQCFRSVYDYTK